MDSLAAPVATASLVPRRVAARVDPAAAASWTLAFALVTYLALRNGGYESIVRSEAGIAVWWLVLLGALAGLLPGRVNRTALVAIGLLAAFTVWTGIAIGWSESADRSVTELGRLAAYLGVLLLAITLQGRTAARQALAGLACAIGLVTVLAVLSRLHPQAFPANDHFKFLGPASARKLSYPLNYWNALAGFAAMGVPLLLAIAVGARSLVTQALAAATIPLSGLCIYLTISRGGTLALAVALVVFIALVPRRLDAFGTVLAAAAGGAILIAATSQRAELVAGRPTPTALHQGDEVLWLCLLVCTGVGLIQVVLALAARHLERPALLAPSPRVTARRALIALVIAIAVAIPAGAVGAVSDSWHQFTAPNGVVVPGADNSVFNRLGAANGNGRYEFWQAAFDANATRPWTGIGPGTFEFWWARHATTDGYIRNAHTLYFETLAETGIIGLLLLGGLLAWLLGVGILRSLRASPELRVWLAGATASLAAFLATASLEWVWQMAAIAAAVMVLGAVIVAGRDDTDAASSPSPRRERWIRAGVVAVALVAMAAVLVPYAGARELRASQNAAAAGDLEGALRHTLTGLRVQPYSASLELQKALVLELAGNLGPAEAAARSATREEPANWRNWLVLSRLDARRGQARAAVADLRQARRLNPRSLLFTGR